MAVENMGGIEFTVDANTAPLIDSEKALGKSVDKMEVKLLKLDKVTAKYTKTLRKSGHQISKTGIVLDKYGKVNDHATTRMQRLVGAQAKLTESAAGVNKAMAKNSRAFGQVSIQAQQFIGQVQGGQGILVAFSQQIADVGIVAGAPLAGAFAGIAASLVGMLLPSLMSTKTGMELMEKATENVMAAMTLGADGVVEYTAEMKKLKAVSETLLQLKIGLLIAEQEAALKGATKALKQSLSDAKGWATGYGAVYKIFKNETKAAFDSYKELRKVTEEFDSKKPVESMKALEAAMQNAEKAGIKNTKVGRELLDQLIDMSVEYKVGEKFLSDLNDKKKDSADLDGELAKTTKKHVDEVASMVAALNAQADAIGKKNREIAISTAMEKGATEAQLKSINAAFDTIEAEEKRVESIKNVNTALDEMFKQEERIAAKRKKAAAAEEAKKGKAVGFAESVTASGLSPIERLEAENAKLLDLKAKYVDDSAVFDEALTVNSKKQADLRAAYQIANTNMILSASSSLFGNLASLLKNSGDEQSSAYKAMFALSKGFAVAQAGLNLALAISNASAISPWYASLPAVASVVSSGAAFAGSIANATYSGRENGGSVSAGQTYEVGEKNKPEMLMIPGNNGKVFSNAEMKSAMGGGGGGGGVIVNLFGAPAGTDVQSRRDPLTQGQVVDIVVGQMGSSNSESMRAMRNVTNVSNRLSSSRRT